jgi:lipopolysaccharide transport system permease protein
MFKRFYNKTKGMLGLSFQLAKTGFKLRNEGSYLGIFWYLLNPILMFSLLLFIFGNRLGNNIEYYPLYLLLGIIMFNLFQSTTKESTKAIIQNGALIKSINFPKEALIFSLILRNLFSHIFEIIIFFSILVFFKISVTGILYYLLLLIPFMIFIFGFSLLLSSFTVYFVDLDNIWEFASTVIWFGTPIFYAIENQTRLFYLNLINPLYYFLTSARDLAIYHKIPPTWMILGIVGFSLIFLFLGLFVFKRLNKKFAELI